VVAGILERRGRLLLAQRPLYKDHGGLWEFPGGKVNAFETLAQALSRELSEELLLEGVVVGELIGRHQDARGGIELLFLRVATDSAPIALEHMALGWYTPREALQLDLAPADRTFLETTLDQVLSTLKSS